MKARACAALFAAAAIASSCAKPRPRVDELVFWQPWPAPVVEPVIREFESANPGVRVRVCEMPLELVGDSVDAARAAGAPPDLCVLDARDMPARLESGVLSDWSAGVADLRDSVRGWPLCTVGDAIYGLPWLLRPRALVYNPELFARAGVDSPPTSEAWTWGQVRAAATRIQRLGRGVHGIGLSLGEPEATFGVFMSLAWGNGGELLSAGMDSSRFDSPQNVETLEFLVSLRKAAALMSADSLREEFAGGRLGMMIADGRAFGSEGRPPSFGVTPMPRPAPDTGESASFADGVVLASFVDSRRKEQALRLARLLVRPASLRAIDGSSFMGEFRPATIEADTTATSGDASGMGSLTARGSVARFAPPVARWDSIRVVVAAAVDAALTGQVTAVQAIADADARIAELAGRR